LPGVFLIHDVLRCPAIFLAGGGFCSVRSGLRDYGGREQEQHRREQGRRFPAKCSNRFHALLKFHQD